MATSTRLITVADDFGLTEGVNAAVERAARQGILTSASLMVAGDAAADAVRVARAVPGLRVGLHLVVIEGPAIMPHTAIAGPDGRFGTDQLRLGVRYYFSPAARRALEAEIRAQFEAFRATGLTLDHANAHKHMHLHPVVGRMMIDIGRGFGLRAVRVPAEPAHDGQSLGDRALRAWCGVLRRQARRAGMLTNDHILGLSDTGHMTPDRVRGLLARLPPGLTELYFHPATARDAVLCQLMPDYEHEAELAALEGCVLPADVVLTSYGAELALARDPKPV